jgi:MoaA/NifB/PqqE/SkfB family radical SAM enzyme
MLIVSVLGDRSTHDELVGRPGTYDTIVQGLRAVAAAKKGRRLTPPLIVLNTPLLAENAATCDRTMELNREIPVFVNHYQHLWFVTDEMRNRMESVDADFIGHYTESIAVDPRTTDPDAIWEAIERVRSHPVGRPLFYPAFTRQEVEDYYASPTKLLKRDHAICAWIFSHVLPNGDVSPCLGLPVGNIMEQSILDIWNNEAFQQFRAILRKRRVLPICARCCVYFRNQ